MILSRYRCQNIDKFTSSRGYFFGDKIYSGRDIESAPGSVHGVSDLLLVTLDVAHTMKLAGFYETGEIQGPEHR